MRGVRETVELQMSSIAEALRQRGLELLELRGLELHVIINKATWLY